MTSKNLLVKENLKKNNILEQKNVEKNVEKKCRKKCRKN